MTTTVILDKCLVIPGFGILLRAQKQHVFQEVGQAVPARGIAGAADMDVHGCTGPIRLGIGNQQDFHPVIEHK